MKKKCYKCGEVKSLEYFSKNKGKKDGHHGWCSNCAKEDKHRYRNTEIGFLKKKYGDIKDRCRLDNRTCYFTVDEFLTAFEKHKSIYGMRSAWGPGIDHLEQHLPITMIYEGKKLKKRTQSNLSVDRLDSNMGYTLQNLIFIRGDENSRKKDTTYEDCKIHMRLHEERFIKMKAI